MEVEYMKQKIKSCLLKKLKGYLSTRKPASNSKNNNKARCAKAKVAPIGYFSVYVGSEKQRFVVKTEYANHRLFRMLLEDAESEYGFSNEGPLQLPCDVDLFYKVLAEMDGGNEEYDDDDHRHCGLGFGYGSCSPFSPARRFGNRTYDRLTPPRLLKVNHF